MVIKLTAITLYLEEPSASRRSFTTSINLHTTLLPPKMTTTTTQTRTARTVLRDYELHHSPSPNPSSGATPAHEARNSPPWPADYRRIPPYRPANTNRDQSQIRVYTSGVERTFIAVMFTGVFLNAVSRVGPVQ